MKFKKNRSLEEATEEVKDWTGDGPRLFASKEKAAALSWDMAIKNVKHEIFEVEVE